MPEMRLPQGCVVTSPNWNGQGRDPWLTDRLEARLQIETSEQGIRRAFWAELSTWLVEAARRVLRFTRPDPDSIWALVPAWHEAVDRVVRGAILSTIGLAYRRTIGSDFPFEQRVFVTRYLAEVRNRMVRLPDEIFDLVAGEVAAGVNAGDSIPELAARVDAVLSTTDSERWPNRATTVARTEAIGAMNAGRSDAFSILAGESDVPMEKIWLATDDTRTRHTHREADGQRVPEGSPFTVGGFDLRFPGDPMGPAQEVINCRCTLLLVEQGETVRMDNRQFRRAPVT